MFRKVDERGGTLIVATFYNPETGEEKTEVVRDYDYADCSRDNDALYYQPIDKEARIAWLHSKGEIIAGDVIKVIKGRKVKLGTTGVVRAVREVCDRYGRWVADYADLETGISVNVKNCIRIDMEE